jgi:hypothetical protein
MCTGWSLLSIGNVGAHFKNEKQDTIGQFYLFHVYRAEDLILCPYHYILDLIHWISLNLFYELNL